MMMWHDLVRQPTAQLNGFGKLFARKVVDLASLGLIEDGIGARKAIKLRQGVYDHAFDIILSGHELQLTYQWVAKRGRRLSRGSNCPFPNLF